MEEEQDILTLMVELVVTKVTMVVQETTTQVVQQVLQHKMVHLTLVV